MLDAETGAQPFALGQTGADALYHVPVPADRDFVLMVEAPGHLFHSERVESGSIQGRRARDFRLEPLAADAEVVLRNVFFESGSAVLSTASAPELREVAAVAMAGNPQARLEVGGHTDDVGQAQDNLNLSSQRAEAVRQFLVDAGANGDQLTAVGYGQTIRPAAEGFRNGRGPTTESPDLSPRAGDGLNQCTRSGLEPWAVQTV